jgi:hypothetical protein
MEMKQMVYVVIENGYVTGVWNEYQNAENHVGEDGVIIPVVVDTYGKRAGCETAGEVLTAMEKELQNMYPSCSTPDDEEEEEEDEEDEEDEEGDEEDEEGTLTDDDIIRGLLGLLYD